MSSVECIGLVQKFRNLAGTIYSNSISSVTFR